MKSPMATSSQPMPDEQAPPAQADVFDGPLASRLVHKNWKARMGAAEELGELFSAAGAGGDGSSFTEFEAALFKLLKDSNMAVLDKVIGAALRWVSGRARYALL